MDDRFTAVAFDLDAGQFKQPPGCPPGMGRRRSNTGPRPPPSRTIGDPGAVDLLSCRQGRTRQRPSRCADVSVVAALSSRQSEKEKVDPGPAWEPSDPASEAARSAPRAGVPWPGRGSSSPRWRRCHRCLVLPINAKEVASMLVHARAGDQPGRHRTTSKGLRRRTTGEMRGGRGRTPVVAHHQSMVAPLGPTTLELRRQDVPG